MESSAHSRQKSCNACVKSKRRCDKRSPRCTRCAEKNFACEYQNVPYGNANSHSNSGARGGSTVPAGGGRLGTKEITPPMDIDPMDLHTTSTAMDFTQSDINEMSLSRCRNSPMLSSSSASGVHGLSSEPSPLALDTSFDFNSVLGFLTPELTPPSSHSLDLWSPEPSFPTVGPMALEDPIGFPRHDFSSECSPSSPPCSSAIQSWKMSNPENKIAFLTTAIRNFPKQFAQAKETSYIHGFVYREKLPRPILEAWTACVAYTFRQPSNNDWAVRILVENVNNLKRFQPISPLDRLARVHAMLFYQMIRLFDGDISLRARAEEDLPVLTTWANDLAEIRDNMQDLVILDASALRDRPPKSWGLWIFHETARRTVVMAHSLNCLYAMLRAGGDSIPPEVMSVFAPVHRWTISSYLWTARSTANFYTAWREKPQYLISNFPMPDDPSNYAKPEDLDDFARMLLSVCNVDNGYAAGNLIEEGPDATRLGITDF